MDRKKIEEACQILTDWLLVSIALWVSAGQCGTNRLFALPVPPDMDTAKNAQRWLNFISDDVDFILSVRT